MRTTSSPRSHTARRSTSPRLGVVAVAAGLVVVGGPSVAAVETTGDEPTTTTVSAGSAGPEFAAADRVLDELVAEYELDGAGLVVVDRESGVVHEHYVGEFDADRVSLVASSSKMITAGVLLRLDDDGVIDIDAPVGEYLDWTGNPEITVAQMMSHSSGLVGLGPDPLYAPYLCQFVGDEMEACAESVFETAEDDADVVPPDSEYRYGGVQWQVVGGIAETVSGKSWDTLVDEIYVEPCGVDSLGYNNHWSTLGGGGFEYPADFDPADLTPTENPHMEGGVFITAPDYAELLLMHLRGGECDGGRVLSTEAVERAHTDRIGEAWGGTTGMPDTVGTGYGFGWFVDPTTGRVTDPGAYGSFPWLDTVDGYGAYLVIEADSVTGATMAGALYEPVEAGVLALR